MIPKVLQRKDFRFCLIRKQSKAPYEKDWANKGYVFDDEKLLKHIKDGGNYGVIGGYGNLRMLDVDDKKRVEEFKKEFQNTFMVETGSGGLHLYFISDYETNHVLKDGLGEFRAKNYQCVGAGSIHPNLNTYKSLNNENIMEVPLEMMGVLLKPYLRDEVIETGNEKDPSGSGLEYRRVIALLKEGKTREEIFKKMEQYTKWATHGKKSPKYREQTYEKALRYVDEIENKKETPKTFTSEEYKTMLNESYNNILTILKEYLDMKPEYYNITALWVMGTYFHDSFPSYPYLFFNAMKGSGKSRAINLITTLSKDGSVQNSMTEAVLFRTKGTLAIDEFEDLGRKGNDNLRELLNSAYKKGTTVKRMKKEKTDKGTEMVVEEFEVYRPIILANIWGMEDVLGDRCITLILERSNKKHITNLIEIFREEEIVLETKLILKDLVYLVQLNVLRTVYPKWNEYVKMRADNYTNYTHYTHHTNYTNYMNLFEIIYSLDLNGRELELSFPLLLISSEISPEVLKETTLTLKDIFSIKKEEEFTENMDISLYDFVSQYTREEWVSVTELTREFKDFLQSNDDDINNRWVGRGLNRLILIKEKKRLSRGIYVKLNIKKAQEKIKMFK